MPETRKNFTLMQQKVVSILDYLDGSIHPRRSATRHTHPGKPANCANWLASVARQSRTTRLSLSHCPPLEWCACFSGATQSQRNLAVQINTGVNNVDGWLAQLHQDAIQLVHMSNAQLALASTLEKLNDMVTQANNAYMGLTNPSTGLQQIGVTQIYRDVQLLATFEVKPYK